MNGVFQIAIQSDKGLATCKGSLAEREEVEERCRKQINRRTGCKWM